VLDETIDGTVPEVLRETRAVRVRRVQTGRGPDRAKSRPGVLFSSVVGRVRPTRNLLRPKRSVGWRFRPGSAEVLVRCLKPFYPC
jgi:hypothetical protein